MISSLLFLDFDGVLHPGLAGTFIYSDKLSEFLNTHQEIGVVISSSWRVDYPLKSLKGMLPSTSPDRILGSIPIFEFEPWPGRRELEIDSWRTCQGFEDLPWAALDDDFTLFSLGCPNLVLCNRARGLRDAQLDKVRSLLCSTQDGS